MLRLNQSRKYLELERYDPIKSRVPARTLAFISNKGGVGKTHIAINMAAQLAQQGRRVLLVDTDLGSANTDLRLGVSPTTTLLDFYEGRADISCCLTNTDHGFQIIAGRPGDFGLANLPDEQIIRLLKAFEELVSKGGYNDILFDLGAGISSRVLDFALVADEIIIIATPNEVVHAYAALKACWTRFLSLQDQEYFREKVDLKSTPYYLRDAYKGDPGAPRINFIVNQVDNLEQGKKVYLRITRVAKNFFFTGDGYWKLPMRYLGGIPDCHNFLKRAEFNRSPACKFNPHHEFCLAINEVCNIMLSRKVIPANRLKITFGTRVKKVLRSWMNV